MPLQLWLCWALFAFRHAGTVRTADALAGVRSPGNKYVQVASGTTEAVNSGVQVTAWMEEEGWFSQFHWCGQGGCPCCVKWGITKEKRAGGSATMVSSLGPPPLPHKSWTSSMKPCWPSPLGVKCCKLTTASAETLGYFLCRHAPRPELTASVTGKGYFKVSMAGFLAGIAIGENSVS